MKANPRAYIFTEDVDYGGTGVGSIWGNEDSDTVQFLEKKELKGSWLDLAAGDGRFVKRLLSQASHLTVSDIDERALGKLVSRLSPDEKEKVTVTVQNIVNPFPFGNNVFDGVFNTGTLHLFPKHILKMVFTEINRVLKPGGMFIFDFATDIKREMPDGRLITYGEESYSLESAIAFLEKALTHVGFQVNIITRSKTVEDLREVANAGYVFSCNYALFEAIKCS